ncbi:MAG: hypothetical protein H7Y00_05120 [Fimbriimonadaceae bacterium]|nr:hypothetical protein [Chitinophagales bacterium]
MKQLFLICVCLLALQTLQAQDRAIGLRINGGTVTNAEISYQQWLGSNNRFEADLGFGGGNYFNVMKLAGLYQWCFELEYPLAWYVGAGASVGYWNFENGFDAPDDHGIFLNIAGQVGIEYTFEIPLQVSLDLRPELGLVNGYTNGIDAGVGLGVRYTF